MSKLRVNNVDLFYRSVGDGAETIFFSHGYLMDNSMFDGQIDTFKGQFRCIAFDHRGHGQSEVTADGYELDNLVTDAIVLIEATDGGRHSGRKILHHSRCRAFGGGGTANGRFQCNARFL